MSETKLIITCISDTHNQHDKLNIEPTNILLHAGDYSSMGRIAETKAFLEWFSKQPADHKVFIDGNHDGLSVDQPALFKEILKEYPGVTYLRHEMLEVEGVKIWGRPTTPRYGDWWHMADRDSPNMRSTLNVIPADIDILLTHGPAKGILDLTSHGDNAGCEDLLNELPRLKCKIMVFGHIHHDSGTKMVDNILHVNAAVLNDNYRLSFIPKIIQL